MSSSSFQRNSSRRQAYEAGQSPFELLPPELLQKILGNLELKYDHKEGGSSSDSSEINCPHLERPTLFSCLRVSKAIYMNALFITYRSVTVTHMSAFNHILAQLTQNPILGRTIRRLDFSELKTARPMRGFSNSLYGMVSLAPHLREFRLPRDTNLNGFLSGSLLRLLFVGLPHLKTLDLGNCTSSTLGCIPSILDRLPKAALLPIKSLSLENCTALPASTFDSLFSRLGSIQSMTLSHTHITTEALQLLPPTARISHLAINHCPLLEDVSLVDFVTSHPSVKHTLVYLDASVDLTVSEEIKEKETELLLRYAPRTIKTLKLRGWKMGSACVAQLKSLNQTIEELSIGTGLRMRDLESIFLDDEDNDSRNQEDAIDSSEIDSKYTTVLEPMERAIAITKLRRRISITPLPTFTGAKHSLRYLDIRGMTLAEQSKIRSSILLGKQSMALDVIAVNDRLMDREGTLKEICASVGWNLKRDGRRCLLVRRKA
ncbi:c20d0b28-dfd2-415c-8aca-a5a420d74d9d [Sclerotinia trifoliorum]|uniref:C20d0b28-dfd2-415c-8aca-a5a420d74d9d n=1 Tax=Sclerotinia trifoliorum TaxID=28548 RepID=A0A8H2VXA6_9HELO|nr:c20d0b28-dfd2-415c-8aca-a5a420d74d9d [Sclerotinia trifoliorum]